MLVVFPVLYYIIHKNKVLGMLAVLLFCIGYEIVRESMEMPAKFYRVCCFRLLVSFALGIVLFLYYDKLKSTVIPVIMLVVGFLFLLSYTYLGYEPFLIKSWMPTSFMAAPYAAGIVFFFIKVEDRLAQLCDDNILFKCLSYIGDSSYHIMLVQQTFFSSDIEEYLMQYVIDIPLALIEVFICVLMGCLFYKILSIALQKFPVCI